MRHNDDGMSAAIRELRTRALIEPFGPIRPEHATNGWELHGDDSEWRLIKRTEGLVLRVKPTTRTTCAWTVKAEDGRFLREASARDVEAAKADAENWAATKSDGANSPTEAEPA
ncbi:hypothetical protein [Nocardia transvalensis]|uniref:hypothetical protein n=1 Tax=Nocardia transvalensis TaxID=37333 RepID=UPI0018942B23|nr:hypothetical protein [Nocardia transvalensis]MBF6331858.1 hypothetical protein [Nocardia transvalensis]